MSILFLWNEFEDEIESAEESALVVVVVRAVVLVGTVEEEKDRKEGRKSVMGPVRKRRRGVSGGSEDVGENMDPIAATAVVIDCLTGGRFRFLVDLGEGDMAKGSYSLLSGEEG